MLGEGLAVWQTGPLKANPKVVECCLFLAWLGEKKLIPSAWSEPGAWFSAVLLHAISIYIFEYEIELNMLICVLAES